jgi:hypothetical protein
MYQERAGSDPLKSLKFKGKQGNQREAMEDKANPALNPSLEPGSRFQKRKINKAFSVRAQPLPAALLSSNGWLILLVPLDTALGQAQQGQVEGSHPPTQELVGLPLIPCRVLLVRGMTACAHAHIQFSYQMPRSPGRLMVCRVFGEKHIYAA